MNQPPYNPWDRHAAQQPPTQQCTPGPGAFDPSGPTVRGPVAGEPATARDPFPGDPYRPSPTPAGFGGGSGSGLGPPTGSQGPGSLGSGSVGPIRPPSNGSRKWTLLVVAAAVAVAAIVGSVILVLTAGSSPEPKAQPTVTVHRTAEATPATTTRATTPATTTAPVVTTTPPVTFRVTIPTGAQPCASSGGGPLGNSARGTEITSCPFANAVRIAYNAAGVPDRKPRVLTGVVSPVTGQAYTMNCRYDTDKITCEGGNNAVVYLY